MFIYRVAISAALLFTTKVARAQARDTTTEKLPDWLIGMSLGVPGSGRTALPQLFTVGLNFTEVGPGHIGADFAVGTMPYLFQTGAFPFGFRGDITFPLVAPHLIVLPAAGTSVMGFGVGGILGLNAGIAAVVHTSGMGLRAGITLHQFIGLPNPVWLAEVGFVSIGIDPP